MPLPVKSPTKAKSARSFFQNFSRGTSRNIFNMTSGLKSKAAQTSSITQQESYLDAATSKDTQKNAALLQIANKTTEEINLLQQNENKILEDILSSIEHASKIEPEEKDKNEETDIFKSIENLFDFLGDKMKKIKDAIKPAKPTTKPNVKPDVKPQGRVAAAAKSIAKGAATGIAAESALSYLTGKDETLSALGIGLSPLATGTVAAVAGIKGAFELSDKLTPESRKGADIRPQDIEKAFGGQINVRFEEDVEPFKKGQVVSVGDILKAWEIDKASKEEQEATIDSLLKTKKAKPVKEAAEPISNVTDPNLRRISTSDQSKGSIELDKIIFDADTIRFLADDLSFGNAPAGTGAQGARPGVQRVSASQMISQPMTSYSDITPGASAETTDAFKSSGPDSLGQDQANPSATQISAGSMSGVGELQRNVSVSEMGNAERVIDFFTKKGYTREQAAGIAANIQLESNFKTDAVGDSGKAYGLAQWHPDRQEKFKAVFGKDIKQASFEEQLEYINWELKGPEKAAGRQLLSATTAADAAMKFDKFYERSSGTTTTQRMQLAEKYMTNDGAKSTTGASLSQASVGSEVGDIALQRSTPRVMLPPAQAPNNIPPAMMKGKGPIGEPPINIRLQQILQG